MLARESAGLTAARRLKKPSEYAAVLRAPRERSVRAVRQMLSIDAAWTAETGTEADSAGVRFGITVGKRNARRAVDRVLVKRVVREACRQQASELERCAARAQVRIDIALRLKSPLVDAQGEALAMSQWRRQVRVEADALLRDVLIDLTRRLSAASALRNESE